MRPFPQNIVERPMTVKIPERLQKDVAVLHSPEWPVCCVFARIPVRAQYIDKADVTVPFVPTLHGSADVDQACFISNMELGY